ncbi:MAG: hydroxymethylglutaryl-CoA lyase [Gammaproteobacteria bacterium]|nr:hydroxymethylglutaryl-CoA lyase [Gammaproteobacteria bacterium]MBT5216336.1 hydroxymethylglutaryl-CoA lyase [Gammaproteobacteria bacterium]MBT5541826.1 hydroxymethylglutaryl-CoA lyase [Gammaproteobacteria bacterium]MBT6074025.1 hydroxymethylglutaryl-CoA lyase [Gammaproteobacteria bacterium]MBT7754448.1 hydroxymethylglutaryl-CoA lyase [Gammaproteobacteria bacterium]
MKKVSLLEVGPRDGLQSEPTILSTDVKRDFIIKTMDAGIKQIEVTSFVHPKKVPQMADAEKLVESLPERDDVSYIGLIMNQRGFERARDCGIDEVGMVIVSTDTYNMKNQNVVTQESIDNWLRIASDAKSAGIRTNVIIACSFGCPYEGEVDPEMIASIAEKVLQGEPNILGLADSVGVAVPNQVKKTFSLIKELAPTIPLRTHLHNTRNTGLANAAAAIEAGVSIIDASTGGIGGCPFAPKATGNIPMDDLLYMLDRSGIKSGVDLKKIVQTSEWLENKLEHSVPAMVPKAGIFPENAEINFQ